MCAYQYAHAHACLYNDICTCSHHRHLFPLPYDDRCDTFRLTGLVLLSFQPAISSRHPTAVSSVFKLHICMSLAAKISRRPSLLVSARAP